MFLTVGSMAPSFSAFDHEGNRHSLELYRGKWILFYFYPKDDTPGCTKEACGFRDKFADFVSRNIVVLGVSKDSSVSHNSFAQKFQLPFPLLVDEEHTIIEAYGAWGLKKFMGKEYTGILRISYLIDPQGRIAKCYEKVHPEEHASQVLADVLELQAVL